MLAGDRYGVDGLVVIMLEGNLLAFIAGGEGYPFNLEGDVVIIFHFDEEASFLGRGHRPHSEVACLPEAVVEGGVFQTRGDFDFCDEHALILIKFLLKWLIIIG